MHHSILSWNVCLASINKTTSELQTVAENQAVFMTLVIVTTRILVTRLIFMPIKCLFILLIVIYFLVTVLSYSSQSLINELRLLSLLSLCHYV